MSRTSPSPPAVERRSAEDRRAQRRYRFLDKRTGFDRRWHYPVLGTLRDSPWLLISLLVALNVMSLADGALTAVEIMLGIATEGNPVLGGLLARNPLLAVAFKLAVIAFVSWSIWRSRHYRIVLATAIFAVAVYAAVLAYHLGSLSGLGWI